MIAADVHETAHAIACVKIVFAAYLIGSIPFGYLAGKLAGIDIREHGSKNIGATNVWRVLGKNWGLPTFLCDVAKGWVAVILGFWLARQTPDAFRDPAFAGIVAAVGCIVGHNFPVWLRFKGGKGVATSLGVIFGMMPLVSLIIFAIWGLVFKTTRYVSLASLLAAIALPLTVVVLMLFGPANGWASVHGWGYFYFAVAAALLVIRRHRENITRLRSGTENRFGTPKPPQPEPPTHDQN